jgi:hypothetical protein
LKEEEEVYEVVQNFETHLFAIALFLKEEEEV